MKIFKRIKRILGYIITPYKNWLKNENVRRRTRYAKYYKKLSVKDNTVLYESFYGRGMVCNPYALFKEMLQNNAYKNYTHIWVLENLQEHKIIIDEYKQYKNVKFVEYNSNDYLKALSYAKILINNSTFSDYFIKKDNQIYINTWHGIPLKVLGYDMPEGAVQSKNVARSLLQTDYLLSANSFLTSIYQNSYKIKEIYKGTIIEEGYPRNDLLFSNRDYVINKLKKYGLKIDTNKKIILYAPTWRGQNFGKPNDTVDEMIDFREQLLNKIDKNKYQVFLKPHNILGKLFKEIGATEYIIPSTFDAGETLAITDILISDFSSIYFDFLTTKKPVLFYITDADEYKEERGLYTSLDELPAPYTNDIDILSNWINSIAEFQTENAIKYKMVRDFCENTDKPNISKLTLDIIIKGENKGKIIKPIVTKKRILIFKGSPLLNGIGTAANNLLNYIDYEKYDITLYMHAPNNAEQKYYVNQLNENCRTLLRVSTFTSTLIEQIKITLSNEYCKSFKFINKIFPKSSYQLEATRCFGNTEFDYVIDFDGYSRVLDLIALQIPVKKRYIWQHNDMYGEKELRFKWLNHLFTLYKEFDGIVSCAESTMEINRDNLNYLGLYEKFTFVTNFFDSDKVLNSINDATYTQIDGQYFYSCESTQNQLRYIPLELASNLIPITLNSNSNEINNQIISKGKVWKNGVIEAELSPFSKEALDVNTKFITVGRCSPEKNHMELIKGFELLLKEYPNIMLYIVGYGKKFTQEYNFILKKKLQNNIIMTNNIKNPFGLMQKCDCFVFPSLHEGQGLVVLEARMLNMPIIVSNFDAVSSVSLPEGQLIIEKDAMSIYQGMKDFIDGKVPHNYNFDYVEYNKKCYREFEALFND